MTPRPTLQQAIPRIKAELKARVDEFVRDGHLLEAQRLQERTTYDMEMLETVGSCNGIENYSAISPAAIPASRRRRCSSTFPRTRC